MSNIEIFMYGLFGSVVGLSGLAYLAYKNISKSYLVTMFLPILMNFVKKDKNLVQIVNNSMFIQFDYNGNKYDLYIPYDKFSKQLDLSRRVIVMLKDIATEINHPPGVPLLVSPKHIGADDIIVEYI